MKPSHLFSALLCALILAYLLSIGPARMLLSRNHRDTTPPQWVVDFYAPLEYAYDHSQPIANAFDWYSDLWLPSEKPR